MKVENLGSLFEILEEELARLNFHDIANRLSELKSEVAAKLSRPKYRSN